MPQFKNFANQHDALAHEFHNGAADNDDPERYRDERQRGDYELQSVTHQEKSRCGPGTSLGLRNVP